MNLARWTFTQTTIRVFVCVCVCVFRALFYFASNVLYDNAIINKDNIEYLRKHGPNGTETRNANAKKTEAKETNICFRNYFHYESMLVVEMVCLNSNRMEDEKNGILKTKMKRERKLHRQNANFMEWK